MCAVRCAWVSGKDQEGYRATHRPQVDRDGQEKNEAVIRPAPDHITAIDLFRERGEHSLDCMDERIVIYQVSVSEPIVDGVRRVNHDLRPDR